MAYRIPGRVAGDLSNGPGEQGLGYSPSAL